MESNQSRIMGHSKTSDVGVGVKLNEIKPVAWEAGSWWKNLTFLKKRGGTDGKIPKKWIRFALIILET